MISPFDRIAPFVRRVTFSLLIGPKRSLKGSLRWSKPVYLIPRAQRCRSSFVPGVRGEEGASTQRWRWRTRVWGWSETGWPTMSASMRSTLQTVPESVPADHVTNSKVSPPEIRFITTTYLLPQTTAEDRRPLCIPRLERPRDPPRLGDNERLQRNECALRDGLISQDLKIEALYYKLWNY